MGEIKGMKDACKLRINKDGNFDLITPSSETIERIIDVDISQPLKESQAGIAVATITLYVNPDNGTN